MGVLLPGITRCSLIVIDAHPAVSELNGPGFPDQNHAGPGQPLHRKGIPDGTMPLQEPRPGRGGKAP